MTDPPRRPMSSYMVWLNSARESIEAQHPGVRVTEIACEFPNQLDQVAAQLNKATESEKRTFSVKQEPQQENDEGEQRPREFTSHNNQEAPMKRIKLETTTKENELLDKECSFLSQSANSSCNTQTLNPLAMYWSQKLDKLSETQRIYAEKFINDILFEAAQGNLTRNSVQIHSSDNLISPSHTPSPIIIRTPTSSSSNLEVKNSTKQLHKEVKLEECAQGNLTRNSVLISSSDNLISPSHKPSPIIIRTPTSSSSNLEVKNSTKQLHKEVKLEECAQGNLTRNSVQISSSDNLISPSHTPSPIIIRTPTSSSSNLEVKNSTKHLVQSTVLLKEVKLEECELIEPKAEKIEKNNKMTVKPKRPMSAYMLWLNSARESIKAQHPSLKVTELAKKCGEIWNTIKDRSVWEEKAAKAKEQYKKDLENYNANGGGGEEEIEPKYLIAGDRVFLNSAGVWVLAADREPESHLERSNRLPCEFADQLDQVADQQNKATESEKEVKNSTKQLLKEVKLEECELIKPKAEKIEKNYKMTDRPNRPMSAYMLWLNSARESIKAKHPGLRVTELAKKGGEIWRGMKDKSVWEEKAAKACKEYSKYLENNAN